uniref:Uncharacterized protein n=1 Tax=Arundo donax TaxID=35708 RepID=A0A0A9ELG2_ARUDO
MHFGPVGPYRQKKNIFISFYRKISLFILGISISETQGLLPAIRIDVCTTSESTGHQC